MASVEPKRPHVLTKRMEEFIQMKQCRGGVPGVSGERMLICPREGCNKVLTSTPGLRYHMRTHVTDLQPYTCLRCKKHFKSFNGLKYHKERSSCENTVFTHIQDHPRQSGGLKKEAAQSEQVAMETDSDNFNVKSEQHDWLRELAIIATGPQSPLLDQNCKMKEEKPDPHSAICQLGPLLHSYARPSPRSRSPSPPPQLIRAEHAYSSMVPEQGQKDGNGPVAASRRQRSYSCPSSPMKQPAGGCRNGGATVRHSSHTEMPDLSLDPVWLCFMAGTKIKFATDCNATWNAVEDLARIRKDEDLAPHGLCVMMMEEVKYSEEYNPDRLSVQLHLTSDVPGQPDIITQCHAHCPFFVRGKGWSSFDPEQTVEHYGIPCGELEVGDVCLPPKHPEAMDASNMIESFRSAELSPMDTSAVLALSGMAKMRREQEMSPTHVPSSPERSPTKTTGDSNKGKRPMNGFMLFAKRYRMEYMQQYPGKDNRAISVLLGDHWKRLGTEERKAFTNEAKMLADQQRRLHPDCWKRKRTLSTSALER